MSELNAIAGRRIAVLAADGFEKVELTVPVAALKMAGADVNIVSLHASRLNVSLSSCTSLKQTAFECDALSLIAKCRPAFHSRLAKLNASFASHACCLCIQISGALALPPVSMKPAGVPHLLLIQNLYTCSAPHAPAG